MKYAKLNNKAIGERIKECRKALPDNVTQEQFGKMLLDISEDVVGGHTRKTIASWEKGNPIPPLDTLLKMCEIFDCELGYLLCEHDTKTRAAADIQSEIGLSESSINILRTANINRTSESDHAIDKISIVDSFINNCEPIVASFSELTRSRLLYYYFELGLSENDTHAIYEIFDDLYYMSHDTEYQKRMDFIEKAAPYLGNDDRSKSDAFDLYNHLADMVQHFQTNNHRYNIQKTFDEIIDSLLEQYDSKLLDEH